METAKEVIAVLPLYRKLCPKLIKVHAAPAKSGKVSVSAPEAELVKNGYKVICLFQQHIRNTRQLIYRSRNGTVDRLYVRIKFANHVVIFVQYNGTKLNKFAFCPRKTPSLPRIKFRHLKINTDIPLGRRIFLLRLKIQLYLTQINSVPIHTRRVHNIIFFHKHLAILYGRKNALFSPYEYYYNMSRCHRMTL